MIDIGLNKRNMNELLAILASVPAIEEAIVFGSRARGDYKPASDIDLALRGKNLTHRDVAVLDDKLYYSYMPYFFDTIMLDNVKGTDIGRSISREGKTLYRHNQQTQSC